MSNKTRLRLGWIVACALWGSVQTRAAVIHRYNFNETDGTAVHDTVGTADGQIKGNGAFFTGTGLLQLPGGGGSAATPDVIAGYVDLPNHIINVLDKVTIETWVTWDFVSSWQRIFDFGTSAGGEEVSDGNGNYLFLSPAGDANLRFAVRDPVTGNEPTQLTAAGPLEVALPVCLTVTYDPAANTAKLYSNAVLLVTGPAPIALKDINDVNNWLGRSQWNDNMFQGSYDEFRIYDTALDAVQVAASFVSGTELPSTDPVKLGNLLAITLTVPKDSLVETDTETVWGTADYANFTGIKLDGVAGASIVSDNPTVVSIDAAGTATALKPGTANLTLTFGGKTDTKIIRVMPRQTGIAVAGSLFVDLRASDAQADALTWTNRAGTGDFLAAGTPTYVANVNNTGVAGVQFAGADAYAGPVSTADLHGSSDCSIEVWAYNPVIADEETLVSWGHRGGPDGSNMSFNYGAHGTWGAVGHWGGGDMGWSGAVPAAGRWHYLVYTFDGVNTAKVFSDGLLRTTESMALNVYADFPIRIAAQANNSGSDFDFGAPLTGAIAMVRVHTGKLSDADVANNFLYGPTLKAPGQMQSLSVELSRPTMTGVRDVGQARVIVNFENLKNVDVTGFSTLESTQTGTLTVTPAGAYTAVGLGSSEIKATYQGLTVSAVVRVVAPPALELKHRYGFNEAPGATTVKDSVGTADGVIKGLGADFDGAGRLVLPGGGSSAAGADVISGYVDLPNHIINTLANVSFEAWVTWDATASAWQRIFDLGTSSGGEDVSNGNGNYLFCSPQGNVNLRFAVRDPRTGAEPTQLTASQPLPQGQEVYVAISYDYNNNVARLYRDGVQVQTGPAAVPLHMIDDVNNWLGRAQWGDPMFMGKYNEFRIWEGALTSDQVAANFAAGANALPQPVTPELSIARSGSNLTISWPSAATGFVLESTTVLGAGASWSTVNTSTAVEQAGRKVLTITAGAVNSYYRMRK